MCARYPFILSKATEIEKSLFILLMYKIMLLASIKFSPLYSHALRDPLRLTCIAVRYVALTLARTTKCLSTVHCRTSLNSFSQDMKVAGREGVDQCSVLAVKRKFLL